MNDMKEQFVTYEIALALKELVFDEPCLATYSYNTQLYDKGKFRIEITPQPFYYPDVNPLPRFILAPLWQQAFRWFRDKHNLDSWIYCPNESKGYFAIILKDKRFVSYNEQFDTYEEAELACLNKLIEIVKENENNK